MRAPFAKWEPTEESVLITSDVKAGSSYTLITMMNRLIDFIFYFSIFKCALQSLLSFSGCRHHMKVPLAAAGSRWQPLSVHERSHPTHPAYECRRYIFKRTDHHNGNSVPSPSCQIHLLKILEINEKRKCLCTGALASISSSCSSLWEYP